MTAVVAYHIPPQLSSCIKIKTRKNTRHISSNITHPRAINERPERIGNFQRELSSYCFHLSQQRRRFIDTIA